MTRLLNDSRAALRSLRRGRGVTAFAVLAFALGIGITTAVFALFYSVLLKPFPYPNPDRLAMVYDVQPACKTCPASYEKYFDWTERSTSFQVLGGSQSINAVITGAGEPERVPAVRATHTLAAVFGVSPAIGRWIAENEEGPSGPTAVVLSDQYWRRRFAADPNVIGKVLTIEGEPHPIVGVMAPEFQHRRGEIFLPLRRAFNAGQRGSHFLQTYARLKPGVSLEQARQEMRTLGEALSGLSRRRELAVRVALGATRWDLARQLTVESIVLAAAGGVLGVLASQWAVSTFVALAGATLPRASFVQIDGMVIAFATGLSLLTGIACGLWPVLRLNSRALGRDVREGDLRTGSAAGGRRFGSGLVVGEIAIAFSLLVGAGLLFKNLVLLERRDTGFAADRLIAFDLAPTGKRYQGPDALRAFYRDLAPRLAALPGVEKVGLTSHLPMYQFGWNGEVTLESGNPWPPQSAPLIERAWIDPSYFQTMGIGIVKGRAFDERDRAGTSIVTIISERTADLFWPGQDPIGRRFARGGTFGGGNPPVEVVGVAKDVRTFSLSQNSPYLMYVPIEQEPFGAMTVVLRTAASDPTTVMPGVRSVVGSIDSMLPVARVQTMAEVVSRSVGQPRLISSLASLFGALAGLLAAVGVYGVMAYNVRRERRAFAIRLALGADPRAVRGLVIVYVVTAAGLLVVTVVAGYVPAFQASRTDPLSVLRAD